MQEPRILVFGSFRLDLKDERLWQGQDVVRVSHKAFAVLRSLVTQAGQLMTKDRLLDEAWPETIVSESVLVVAIRELRRALGDQARAPQFIETVHRRGYRFIAPIQACSLKGARSNKPYESRQRTNSAMPMRRQAPFIAYAQHLDQLMHALQEAISGQPRIVLIQGEAGIGKTRLLKEFQAVVQQREIAVCYGRCSEELALPYLPFVESLLLHLENAFKDDIPPVEVDMEAIRWFRHPREAPPLTANGCPSSQDHHNKLRLFLAVSRATIEFVQHRSICFLLDDLHWADHASLELLEHLMFTIADAGAQGPVPLLIAATYRPPEFSSRLTRVIPRWQGETICELLDLTGFSASDIATYIQEVDLGRPSNQLVAMIQKATQGNPLFIQEVLHYLVRNNALQARGGSLIAPIFPTQVQLPGHLTGALTRRLEELSDDTQQALTFASFLGDRFSLQALSATSSFQEEDWLNFLEEAVHHGLLLNEDQNFRFTHPLIRHVLYNAPSAARRQRLHYQLAETLERLYAANLEAHSIELAHHLLGAGPLAETDKVLTYARQAGAQAFSMFAWADAAHYYEAALMAAESAGRLTDLERAELHYQAGLAYHRAADSGPSLEHYDKAIESYRRVGDVRRLARTLLEQTRVRYALSGVSYGAMIDIQPLDDARKALGEGDLGLCGHIAATLSEIYWTAQHIDKAEEMAQYALDIGQRIGDDHLGARAMHSLALVQALGRRRVKDALESWGAALTYARQANDLWLQNIPLPRMSLILSMLGRLDTAERVAQEAHEVSRTIQSWDNGSLVLASLTAVNVIRGDFNTAEKHAHETLVMMSRSRYAWGASRALFTLASAFMLRGAWAEAETRLNMQVEPGCLFDEPSQTIHLFVKVFSWLLLAQQGGQPGEAMKPLAEELTREADPDAYPLALFCAIAEVGDLIEAPDLATCVYQTLTIAAERDVLFTSGWIFLVPRVLGVVATLNHWWETVEIHFQAALSAAMRTGARPELARTYLDYARMLIAKGSVNDQNHRLQLARQAYTIFDDLFMLPFAQRDKQLIETL